MSSLPRTAQIYIFLLTAFTAGAVSFSIHALGVDTGAWVIVFVVAVAIATFDLFPIRLYGEQVEITISSSIKFAAVLLYPPPLAILGIFFGTWIGEIPIKRNMWEKKVFNISQMTMVWVTVAWVYQIAHQSDVDYFGSLQNVLALVLIGGIDFILNSALVSLIVSLAAHLPFRYVWSRNFRQIIWQELSMVPLGAFLAVLYRFNPVSVLLAGLPLLVVRHSYKIALELQSQTLDALHALVQVVDERDHHTFDHSDRVSNYARSIAVALDLPPEDIEVLTPAALLHDLGKVGMPDDILFNPKLLNPKERARAQRHAEAGAMLLAMFPLFERGAILVRHHHEHYDGKGYPDGLAGEEIPIGARIISVADAFQAMIEDRPYRRALTQAEAIAQLVEGSGTQFDPRVVRAFIQTLDGAAPRDPPDSTATPKLVET